MSDSAIGFLGWNRRTAKRCGGMLGAPSEAHAELGAADRRLQRFDVGHRLRRLEAFAIDRREPVAPAPRRRRGSCSACSVEPVVPGGRRVGQRALRFGEIGRRAVRRMELQRVERLGERRLGAAGAGDRCHVALPRLLQDAAEALAQRRVEALARREHQAAREAADGIAAHEQRHPAPLLELQDAERMVVERVGSIWNSSSRG